MVNVDLLQILYIVINSCVILSGVLYIPIMISVRKLSNLASAQENTPQNYIFLQTIAVIVFKFVSLRYYYNYRFLEFQIGLFPVILLAYEFTKEVVMLCIVLIAFLDLVGTPLMIQLSYLGCNKRNVKVMLSSFDLKRFLITILTNYYESNAVHPQN